MKFDSLISKLRKSWDESPALEPSAGWRIRLATELREESEHTFLNMFAAALPRYALSGASIAVLIVGLSQLKPKVNSDDDLCARYFDGDYSEQTPDQPEDDEAGEVL